MIQSPSSSFSTGILSGTALRNEVNMCAMLACCLALLRPYGGSHGPDHSCWDTRFNGYLWMSQASNTFHILRHSKRKTLSGFTIAA
jgi:hypothetical protein